METWAAGLLQAAFGLAKKVLNVSQLMMLLAAGERSRWRLQLRIAAGGESAIEAALALARDGCLRVARKSNLREIRLDSIGAEIPLADNFDGDSPDGFLGKFGIEPEHCRPER